jgi:hypothetical protein
VPKNIFESKKDKVSGEWRILSSEGLHDLSNLPYIVTEVKWVR